MNTDRYAGYLRTFAALLLLAIAMVRPAFSQPFSSFEAALTGGPSGSEVRKGTALVTLQGDELRIIGTISGLTAPWSQADIYVGDPDDGGQLLVNLAIRLPDPNALAGGFERTITLTNEQVESLQENLLFVSITTLSSDPQHTRVKGRLMASAESELTPMETPLTTFFAGQPVARGSVRAIPGATTLRLVGFSNGLGSNWQQIVVSKGLPGSERETVAALFGFFDTGLYVGFDHTLEIGEGWHDDFANGLFHVEIMTSRALDGVSGQLLPAGNQAPPVAELLEPTQSSSIIVGGFGGSVDPDVYLGQVSIAPVEDPDGNPVGYGLQASLHPNFAGTMMTYKFGVDSTRMHLTVATAAELFDFLLIAREGGIPINSARTIFFRTVTTDGSLFAVGDPVDVTFVRGLITSTESDPETPSAFRVHGNYPNPFNPSTTVMFDLDAASDVTIEVYDILGKRVLTVPAGLVSAGSDQQVRIDASRLTSGTYVYRLVAASASGTRFDTGRMTLMK